MSDMSQTQQALPDDMRGFDVPYSPPVFPKPSYLSESKEEAAETPAPAMSIPALPPEPRAAAAPAAQDMTPLVTPPVYEKRPGPPVVRVPSRIRAETPVEPTPEPVVEAPVEYTPFIENPEPAPQVTTPMVSVPVYERQPGPPVIRKPSTEQPETRNVSETAEETATPQYTATPAAPIQSAAPANDPRPAAAPAHVARTASPERPAQRDVPQQPPQAAEQRPVFRHAPRVPMPQPAAHPRPTVPVNAAPENAVPVNAVPVDAAPITAVPGNTAPAPTTPINPQTAASNVVRPQPPRPAAPSVQVPEPMAVMWQGVEYAVAKWDVHGFTLQTEMPRIVAPGRGRVFDVTLLVGNGGTRIEMRVQARLDAEAGQANRYTFVDLARPQAEVLHRIVDSVVANQAMSLTKLLNETEETRVTRQETGDRMRGFRTAFQLSLAGLVLAAAGMVMWSSFASVKARYAAVTAGATSLSVPIAGRISDMNVTPGDRVMTGDVLGYVLPSNQDDRIATVIERRNRLEVERAELMARRGAMTQLTDIEVSGQDSQRERLEQTLQIAERRLSVERAQLASLRSSGLPTASRQRDRARQEAAVLDAEGDVLTARTRLDDLTRSLALAPMGVLAGGRSNATTFETVDLRLANLDSEIAALSEREARGQIGEPITSPCDCTVQQVDRRRGEWAEPGQQLAVLVGAEAPTVHALIMSEDARSIDIGDSAQIDLADGTSITGSVTRLNYDPHWLGYTGLQDNVFAADRYARIEVTPEGGFRAPVGMVADVSVHTNAVFGGLASLVGL